MPTTRTNEEIILDQFFVILQDEAWHDIKNISNLLRLPISKTKKLCQHFSEYNIMKFEEKTGKIRVTPAWNAFLRAH